MRQSVELRELLALRSFLLRPLLSHLLSAPSYIIMTPVLEAQGNEEEVNWT